MLYINSPEDIEIENLQAKGNYVFVKEGQTKDQFDSATLAKIKKGYKIHRVSEEAYDNMQEKEKLFKMAEAEKRRQKKEEQQKSTRSQDEYDARRSGEL